MSNLTLTIAKQIRDFCKKEDIILCTVHCQDIEYTADFVDEETGDVKKYKKMKDYLLVPVEDQERLISILQNH